MKDKFTPKLDEFFDSIRNDVEEKITKTISDEKIIEVLNGGKRLRSLLSQLIYKVCTQGKESKEEYQRSLEGAVSIELAHGASLIHDDIIDRDTERRGHPAYHVKEGIGNAILIGHKMLALGFQIALKHGKEFAKLYVDSWNEVVNGELIEINFENNFEKVNNKFSIFEAYNKIIDLKTASLFASACEAGALEANMSRDILRVFREYGREIGLAYQLADDLVDLSKGEMIDTVVLPLLNKLENKSFKGTVLKRWFIKRKFAKNEKKIKELYIKSIEEHVRKAEEISKSDIIPYSKYKELLMHAPSYIINKMLREVNITI